MAGTQLNCADRMPHNSSEPIDGPVQPEGAPVGGRIATKPCGPIESLGPKRCSSLGSVVAERPGARRDVATCLEVQAGFFATTDPARAARLFGAAESLRESLGLVFEQAERETDARGRTLASTALGQVVFRAALAEGRQLPLQAAVELSLAPAECTPSCSSNRSEDQHVSCVAARLTTREVEVARLISKGLSNREIADELVIAERTAEAHVTHLLNKLGLRSRAQVAVWAVEQRLAKLHSD